MMVTFLAIGAIEKKNICRVYVFLFATLFFSCQDKYLTGHTPVATGSLKSNTTGDCLSQVVAGTYMAGKEINDSNYIQVTINVKTTGTYTVNSTKVNGYSFTGSGTCNTIGNNLVKLAAKGKPLAAGTDIFAVSFDTSTCHIGVAVLAVGGSTATPAVYTLLGGPNTCLNDSLSGSFVKGMLLDTFSRVTLAVNVITAGSYTVTTAAVNGFKFSGSGVFTQTGVQKMTLTASGMPLNSGVNDFSVTGNSSMCTFPVTVLVGVAVTNNDHLPLTYKSFWNYDDILNTPDTLKRIIVDSMVINGSLYKTLEERQKFGAPVSYALRRVDSVYYEYGAVDKYTVSMKFLPAIIKDIPVLREYLSTGDTWNSDEFIGPASFGQQLFLRYHFTCANANAIVTINGKTFTNVYKIVMLPQIRSAVTYPYAGTGEQRDLYYAKGIGLIYVKSIVQSSTSYTQTEWQIRNWLIN